MTTRTKELSRWQKRAALSQSCRQFFAERDFLEIMTPVLVPMPGTEIHLDYFSTSWQDHQKKEHPFFLRSSPELHMKQALADGCERIYQIATSFRNGGEFSDWHHPEFLMLEWYETGISYDDFILQTEAFLRATHQALQKKWPREVAFVLPAKLQRFTVAEAFDQFASLDLVDQDQDLAAKAKQKGILSVREGDDFETAFFKILLERIEPALEKFALSVLYDYPASQAALAKIEGGVAKRFEFYAGRLELCNAFFELTDEKSNQERLETSQARRRAEGKQAVASDQGFLDALKRGLPPCCGNALGLDRWLGVLMQAPDLDQVVPFRQLFGSKD